MDKQSLDELKDTAKEIEHAESLIQGFRCFLNEWRLGFLSEWKRHKFSDGETFRLEINARSTNHYGEPRWQSTIYLKKRDIDDFLVPMAQAIIDAKEKFIKEL